MGAETASLKNQLRATLVMTDKLIDKVHDQARDWEIDPYAMKDTSGHFVLTEPLLTRSNCLLALSILHSRR